VEVTKIYYTIYTTESLPNRCSAL